MRSKFYIRALAFFIPVILGYMTVEWLTAGLNSGYEKIGLQLESEANDIEVMILGSSQMKDAVNPEWLSLPAINMASGNQHHNTDFKLLKGRIDDLPALHTVVLEVSYSHFELPHNPTDFWKNPIYLKYYGMNTFERPTWFKDRLIYLSNPSFYSEKIWEQFIDKKNPAAFNRFGFDTLNYGGLFRDLEYDEERIAQEAKFKINRTENPDIFKRNVGYFLEFMEYMHNRDLNIVLCHVPMYKTYHPRRNPRILKRRDSIIELSIKTYPSLRLLDLENDTLNYEVGDFWNQSHLNPNGAKKFSRQLDELLRLDAFNSEK